RRRWPTGTPAPPARAARDGRAGIGCRRNHRRRAERRGLRGAGRDSGAVCAVIRVLLADDQALVRAGFRVLLETEDGFEVCGEAADGREAVEMTRSYRPDVVVMDVRMPIMDGLSATAAITGDAEL